jgi:hypothetical protein
MSDQISLACKFSDFQRIINHSGNAFAANRPQGAEQAPSGGSEREVKTGRNEDRTRRRKEIKREIWLFPEKKRIFAADWFL